MYEYNFELLETLGFANNGVVSTEIDAIPSRELEDCLRYYRESMINAVNGAAKPTGKELSALRSSQSCRGDLSSVLPSAIVYDRVVIDDPIARLFTPSNGNEETVDFFLPMNHDTAVNVSLLKRAIGTVLSLRPLIQSQAVLLAPISSLHDSSGNIPIYYSEDWFISSLPKAVFELGQARRQIYAGIPINEGGVAFPATHTDEPSRLIAVDFEGDLEGHLGAFYIYAPITEAKLEADGHFAITHGKPDYENPPREDEYQAWVLQSVNRTLINRLTGIGKETVLAARCGASYCTESRFEAELLAAHDGVSTNSLRKDEVNFLAANEEELQLQDPTLVARLRDKYAKQLRHLRIELAGICDELKDREDFERKAQQAFVERIQPQIREVDLAAKRLSAEVIGGGTLAGLAASLLIAKPEYTPMYIALYAALHTAAGTRKQVVDFLQSRKGPPFLWHQLARK